MPSAFGGLLKQCSRTVGRLSLQDLKGCPFMVRYAKQNSLEALDKSALAQLAAHCPALQGMQSAQNAPVDNSPEIEVVQEASCKDTGTECYQTCGTAQKMMK